MKVNILYSKQHIDCTVVLIVLLQVEEAVVELTELPHMTSQMFSNTLVPQSTTSPTAMKPQPTKEDANSTEKKHTLEQSDKTDISQITEPQTSSQTAAKDKTDVKEETSGGKKDTSAETSGDQKVVSAEPSSDTGSTVCTDQNDNMTVTPRTKDESQSVKSADSSPIQQAVS